MSNATLVITISTPRSVASLAGFLKNTSEPREECRALSRYFERVMAGVEPGKTSFDVQTSASAPVKATNTLTLTYGSISNNDTFVLAGTTFTCVTGTPSGAVQFKKQTDASTTAANLIAMINAHTTLNKLCVASKVSGVVTFTLLTPGALGNQVPLVGSTGMVVGAATFANGAGGSETVAVNYARG